MSLCFVARHHPPSSPVTVFYGLRILLCVCREGRRAAGWIRSPEFRIWQRACAPEGRVTFVSELFQLRLLCSVLQLFLISHSILLLLLLLLSHSQHPIVDNPQPLPAIPPRPLTLHTDTRLHPISRVKIETHTTTGVYTCLSVFRGFGVIDEVAKEMRRDRLHCVWDTGKIAEGRALCKRLQAHKCKSSDSQQSLIMYRTLENWYKHTETVFFLNTNCHKAHLL